jgi:hypothetical protein
MRAQAKARSFLILARRRGGLSKFKQNSFPCLNNTTPALRATPPQLRRAIASFVSVLARRVAYPD